MKIRSCEVVRLSDVVGERHGERVQASTSSSRQANPARRTRLQALSGGQGDLAGCAGDHHRGHHQPPVDAIGDRADRKDAERRADYNGRGKERRIVRRHADPDGEDRAEREGSAVGRPRRENRETGERCHADEP
jgi:hypothetical protein